MGSMFARPEEDGGAGAGAAPGDGGSSGSGGGGGGGGGGTHAAGSGMPDAGNPARFRYAAGDGDPSGGNAVLYVKTLTGVTYTIEHVSWNATVIWLKKRLEEVSGVPVANQRLIFAGKQQEDQRLLAWIGGQTGSTLHLIERDQPPVATADKDKGADKDKAGDESGSA